MRRFSLFIQAEPSKGLARSSHASRFPTITVRLAVDSMFVNAAKPYAMQRPDSCSFIDQSIQDRFLYSLLLWFRLWIQCS